MIQLSPTTSTSANSIPDEVTRRSADELLPLIADLGLTPHVYPVGVELFHQGEAAQEIFFIETGLAKLVCCEEGGRELIADIRLAGTLLGLSGVIRKQNHHSTAITASRCRLMRVSAKRFMELMNDNPRLAITVQQILSDEVIKQAARISEFACLSARQRLENFIWRIIQQDSSTLQTETKLQLPLRQWEVAQFLAITPGYLCRLLAELESEELITRRNGWIVIATHGNLWHRAD
ncbi:MAG TPA: Crp/Fnr family transcriptional regulator [Pyrinomonadaceae bacterium]|nr:Crp/Fnr family transcriptional regulator [Pyrinomonadaceae bacterium]